MFELLQQTKTKLLEFKTLSKKNRPADEKPGVKLKVEQQLPNTFLDHFDPALKTFLYERAKGAKSAQASLDGVSEVTDAPNLTDAAVKLASCAWHHDMTGYEVDMIRGAGLGKGTVHLTDAVLSEWRMTWKEGGTVVVRYAIEAGNIPGDAWETFAELKSREFEMLARPPVVTQKSLDDIPLAPVAPARKPGAAERAAVDKVRGATKPVTPHKANKPTKAEVRAAAEAAFKKEPEPKPGPVVTTRQPAGSRTARGLEATKKALKEGAAVAGVTPAGAWPFPKDHPGEAPPQSSTIENVKGADRSTEGAPS